MVTKQYLAHLLKEKADVELWMAITPMDGYVEVKSLQDKQFIYLRKREDGKYKSTFLGEYEEQSLHVLKLMSKSCHELKKDKLRIDKEMAKLGYKEGELKENVLWGISRAKHKLNQLICDTACLLDATVTQKQVVDILDDKIISDLRPSDIEKVTASRDAWSFILDKYVACTPCGYKELCLIDMLLFGETRIKKATKPQLPKLVEEILLDLNSKSRIRDHHFFEFFRPILKEVAPATAMVFINLYLIQKGQKVMTGKEFFAIFFNNTPDSSKCDDEVPWPEATECDDEALWQDASECDGEALWQDALECDGEATATGA